MFWRTDSGQATVEAAFLIPVLFIVMMVLLQPGIILYDRMVMNHAAAEACRMLATSTGSADSSKDRCEELIRRRLGAIPQQDLFHIHEGGCSYRIALNGDESSQAVQVEITNRIRPLPLNILGSIAGASSDGSIRIHVVQRAQAQPEWLSASSNGASPESWVHGRD